MPLPDFVGSPQNNIQFSLKLVRASLISETASRFFKGSDTLAFADIPQDVVVTCTANYTDEAIPGRSEPWVNYGYTSGTSVTFTGKLIATGESLNRNTGLDTASSVLGYGLGLGARFYSPAAPFLGIGGNAVSAVLNQFRKDPDIIGALYTEVHEKVAWIEALTKPQYDYQGRAFPPPMIVLSFGENFGPPRRGILKTVTFSYHGPFEVNSLFSYAVDCNITFQEVNVTPKGYVDVRNRTLPTTSPEENKWSAQNIGKQVSGFARSTFGI